jgi:hypothetical protein
LVEPGGAVVIASDGCGVWSGSEPWQQAVRQVIQDWLGPARRAGRGTFAPDDEPWEAVLARSPFGHLEWYRLTFQRQWQIDGIIGFLYSTSFCAAPLLGTRREPFEQALREALLAIEPSGHFEEPVLLEAMLARRPRPVVARGGP